MIAKYQKRDCFSGYKIYIDENIDTIVYQKEKGHQSFLHSKPDQLLSLKQRIPYSQALRLLCLTVTELQNKSKKLIEKFIDRGYKASDLKEKLGKANTFDRAKLRNHSKDSKNRNLILLVIT